MTYAELFNQVLAEFINLPISGDLPRQLCELSLNIVLIRTQVQTKTAILTVPSAFNALPLVAFDAQFPDFLLPIAFRLTNLEQLDRSSINNVMRDPNTWNEFVTTPSEYYLISTNMVGFNKTPFNGLAVLCTYVPYIEVLSMAAEFHLDDAHVDTFMNVLRYFMRIRRSDFESAKALIEVI